MAQIGAAGPCGKSSLTIRRFLDEENISTDTLPVDMIPEDCDTIQPARQMQEFSCRTETAS